MSLTFSGVMLSSASSGSTSSGDLFSSSAGEESIFKRGKNEEQQENRRRAERYKGRPQQKGRDGEQQKRLHSVPTVKEVRIRRLEQQIA